jgi:uncharacterized protein involved in response to NO
MQRNVHNITTNSRMGHAEGAAIALFSYGFRPFFLGAAIWALVAISLLMGSLAGLWDLAPSYGALAWHGHEMLFGYASGVVAGFLLHSGAELDRAAAGRGLAARFAFRTVVPGAARVSRDRR